MTLINAILELQNLLEEWESEYEESNPDFAVDIQTLNQYFSDPYSLETPDYPVDVDMSGSLTDRLKSLAAVIEDALDNIAYNLQEFRNDSENFKFDLDSVIDDINTWEKEQDPLPSEE